MAYVLMAYVATTAIVSGICSNGLIVVSYAIMGMAHYIYGLCIFICFVRAYMVIAP